MLSQAEPEPEASPLPYQSMSPYPSSPSSKTPPSSYTPPSSNQIPKTMEDIWRDINLTSETSTATFSGGLVLQDFLNLDTPPPLHPRRVTPLTSPPHPLANLFTLTPTQYFHFVDASGPSHFHHSPLDNNTGECNKKKQELAVLSGDHRRRRMIKNRESAARSRARKQAYTHQLEREVAYLMEENARLRRQEEELRFEAKSQVTGKRKLHRTSTAPF